MRYQAHSRVSSPLILATAALSFLGLHCSSDDPMPGLGVAGTSNTPTSGSGGGGGAAGTGTAAGGTAAGTAGMAAAGMNTGGKGGMGGAGGAGTAGSAGNANGGGGSGAGGSSGGAAGSSGAGGGSNGVTFAQVKSLLGTSCAAGDCHKAGGKHIDWKTETGLYERLTTPIGTKAEHCGGSTPVIPNMPDQSLLVQIVKGQATCMKAGGGTEMVDKMPFMCGPQGQRQCLTDAQIKILTDWISGGAKM